MSYEQVKNGLIAINVVSAVFATLAASVSPLLLRMRHPRLSPKTLWSFYLSQKRKGEMAFIGNPFHGSIVLSY